MAALAGGAALAGRNKGNVSKTAAMEDANIGTNAPDTRNRSYKESWCK